MEILPPTEHGETGTFLDVIEDSVTRNGYIEKIKRLREKLGLSSGIGRVIPDDLLLLAFTSRTAPLSENLRKYFLKYYGADSYEYAEWYGDGILNAFMSRAIYDKRDRIRLSGAHELKKMLLSNKVLYHLMSKKDLCDDILSKEAISLKTCADIVEAILGLFYNSMIDDNVPNAFESLYAWFIITFEVDSMIEQFLKTGSLIIPINGRYGEWSEWGSCSANCGTGTAERTRECNNPTPSSGGRNCIGPDKETKICEETIGCEEPTEPGKMVDWKTFETAVLSDNVGRFKTILEKMPKEHLEEILTEVGPSIMKKGNRELIDLVIKVSPENLQGLYYGLGAYKRLDLLPYIKSRIPITEADIENALSGAALSDVQQPTVVEYFLTHYKPSTIFVKSILKDLASEDTYRQRKQNIHARIKQMFRSYLVHK
jgi:hypothetical protein